MTRRIAWTKHAERQANRLEREDYRRILRALRRYAETEHGDVVKLTDVSPPQWRLRVGDHRVRFRVTGDTLEVLHVLPRGKAYR
jgi:mRNA-degrading endonuclease RelE of RelBE toxin-antitoxin system